MHSGMIYLLRKLHTNWSINQPLKGERELRGLRVYPIFGLYMISHNQGRTETKVRTVNSSNPFAISGISLSPSPTITISASAYMTPNSPVTACSKSSLDTLTFVIGELTLSTPLALMKGFAGLRRYFPMVPRFGLDSRHVP